MNTAKVHNKPTDPHTDVLVLATRLTYDSLNTTVTGSVEGVITTPTYVACIRCNKKIENDDK